MPCYAFFSTVLLALNPTPKSLHRAQNGKLPLLHPIVVSTTLASLLLPSAATASVLCIGGFCGEPALPSLSVPDASSMPAIQLPSVGFSSESSSDSSGTPSLPLPSLPALPDISFPSLGQQPSEEEKKEAALAEARAREELAAKRELMRKVRAERMAQEARAQSEEYIRMRAAAAEMGFGSTVSVK